MRLTNKKGASGSLGGIKTPLATQSMGFWLWPGLRASESLLNDTLKLQSKAREKPHRPPGLGGVKDCEKEQSSLNTDVISDSLLGLCFCNLFRHIVRGHS